MLSKRGEDESKDARNGWDMVKGSIHFVEGSQGSQRRKSFHNLCVKIVPLPVQRKPRIWENGMESVRDARWKKYNTVNCDIFGFVMDVCG